MSPAGGGRDGWKLDQGMFFFLSVNLWASSEKTSPKSTTGKLVWELKTKPSFNVYSPAALPKNSCTSSCVFLFVFQFLINSLFFILNLIAYKQCHFNPVCVTTHSTGMLSCPNSVWTVSWFNETCQSVPRHCFLLFLKVTPHKDTFYDLE